MADPAYATPEPGGYPTTRRRISTAGPSHPTPEPGGCHPARRRSPRIRHRRPGSGSGRAGAAAGC
ncbi:hypothetical protein, partial [Streptomyces viridochromogenes]|uniref:hypothetical protein n=1 Tax=Streptomyces viridochromogenes TaxID=1938 RepID=UPI001F270FAC